MVHFQCFLLPLLAHSLGNVYVFTYRPLCYWTGSEGCLIKQDQQVSQKVFSFPRSYHMTDSYSLTSHSRITASGCRSLGDKSSLSQAAGCSSKPALSVAPQSSTDIIILFVRTPVLETQLTFSDPVTKWFLYTQVCNQVSSRNALLIEQINHAAVLFVL